jgi:hypothetical protein
MLDAYRICSVL